MGVGFFCYDVMEERQPVDWPTREQAAKTSELALLGAFLKRKLNVDDGGGGMSDLRRRRPSVSAD